MITNVFELDLTIVCFLRFLQIFKKRDFFQILRAFINKLWMKSETENCRQRHSEKENCVVYLR
jgi:hypothetical protein